MGISLIPKMTLWIFPPARCFRFCEFLLKCFVGKLGGIKIDTLSGLCKSWWAVMSSLDDHFPSWLTLAKGRNKVSVEHQPALHELQLGCETWFRFLKHSCIPFFCLGVSWLFQEMICAHIFFPNGYSNFPTFLWEVDAFLMKSWASKRSSFHWNLWITPNANWVHNKIKVLN